MSLGPYKRRDLRFCRITVWGDLCGGGSFGRVLVVLGSRDQGLSLGVSIWSVEVLEEDGEYSESSL